MRWSNPYNVCVILIFFLIQAPVFGQKTKTELEKEKRENLQKIAEAEKILADTEKEKRATVGQLRALNQQISAREGLINSLNQEVRLIDGEMGDLGVIVKALQRDLEILKEEYAAMIYSAYKTHHGFNKITFLFSASTFNQLFQRLKYLEQYGEARKNQAAQIEAVSKELTSQRNQLEVKRREQNVILSQQIAENKKLLSLKTKQNSLIANLSQREKELSKELAARKKAVDELDNLIAEVVRKEIERSKSLSSAALANEEQLSNVFESNKNKLNWPVSPGFISQKFGRQPHPVLKGIMEDNPGVNIQTSPNVPVKSVFDGKVIQKVFVPGMNNAVIIQHGEYYTLYAKLKEVNVKIGQPIAANDVIGTVYTDNTGLSELHFEVWKQRIKLNPEQWLLIK
ncbi:MAG: peptidoglycan DD-metalloendopeptidase family protein [Cyclobacteriaceae bacterium]